MQHPYVKKWCRWHHKKPQDPFGILIVSDQNAESFLPWWWSCYAAHNNYPVILVDLGLSKKMRDWCKGKMKVETLNVDNSYIKMQGQLKGFALKLTHYFSSEKAWEARIPWFKKPLAALKTPFEKTILMDVDCEVRGSLEPLFEEAGYFPEVGCVVDPISQKTRYSEYKACPKGETQYNSGMVLFHHGAKTILKWAQLCLEKNDSFFGDQEALSSLSLDPESHIFELNSRYNTLYHQMLKQKDPLIVHWTSSHGKMQLLLELAVLGRLSLFPSSKQEE